MTEELESLKRIIDKLGSGDFDYMLTGSMAMGFYSIPRMTRDSDIVIVLHKQEVMKFVNLLSNDFFIDEFMVKESLEKNLMFNIFDRKSLFKIDFIIKTDDEYEVIKFERKRKLKINSFEVNVISVEDLIISKLIWSKDSHSELQLKDIKNLMNTNTNTDSVYIELWLKKLNITELYNKLRLENE